MRRRPPAATEEKDAFHCVSGLKEVIAVTASTLPAESFLAALSRQRENLAGTSELPERDAAFLRLLCRFLSETSRNTSIECDEYMVTFASFEDRSIFTGHRHARAGHFARLPAHEFNLSARRYLKLRCTLTSPATTLQQTTLHRPWLDRIRDGAARKRRR